MDPFQPAPGQRQARNSALELLRILAMLFIVLSHACVHSGFDPAARSLSLNSLFVRWSVLGNLGVDIYVLLSGYFLCRKKSTLRQLLRLLLQVWFYSLTLFVICRFGFRHTYTPNGCWRVFLPTIFQEYWFFTAYFVLSLLAPCINLFLEKAERRTLRNLILTMFLLWVLIPTFTLQTMFSSYLEQFLFFYLVGAYFRLYPDHVLRSRKAALCLTGASFLLLFGLTVAFDLLRPHTGFFLPAENAVYSRDSLLIVACALGLFSYFLNLPAFTSRAVNAVSACTFGVYLIHDNPAVRSILWLRLFRHADYFGSRSLIPRILISVVLVFCLSALVDFFRQRLLNKHVDRLCARIEARLTVPKAPERKEPI